MNHYNTTFHRKTFLFVLAIVLLLLQGFSLSVNAQTTIGPNNAGTGTNVTGTGTIVWLNPVNTLTNDNTYATITLNNATSNYLRTSNYGFAIPLDAIITGITVTIGRFQNTTGTGNDVRDVEVRLLNAGAPVGSNYAVTGTDWPTTETVANYGGTNNLWGTSWLPSQVNASDFGVSLVVNSTNNRTASVDYIMVSITYITSPFEFNASGSFTVPSNVSCVQVEAWGGGGRGGSYNSGNNVGYGGGGGGGYSRSILNVAAGTYTVTVGAGATTTAAGGDSWFNTNATILAKGGSSVANNSATGANGGVAGIGDVTLAGGKGANGYYGSGTDYGGGGGSSAGYSLAGNSATNASGATAPTGGGNGGNGFSSTSTSGSGTAGSIPGGGGGGALRYASGTATGGNGANGKVIISWEVVEQPSAITGSTAPCSGYTQTYSVSNVAGVTYTWAFPSDWTITAGQGTSSVTVTVGSLAGNVQVTPSVYCNGTPRTMGVNPVLGVPVQPGAITGNDIACKKTTQNYSVPNVPGVTYTWTGPSGSTVTSGQGTNSVSIFFGTASGNVTVTPSNACGNGLPQTLAVTIQLTAPAQPSAISGVSAPCQGSTQTYSVTNVVGVLFYLWSVPADWNILSGQGTNSITVLVGTNSGMVSATPQNTCGGGNPSKLPVATVASIPAKPVFTNGEVSVCQGSDQYYTIAATPYTYYNWTVPSDWIIISGQGTNEINVTAGATSGLVEVTPSNNCGNGPSGSLTVTVDIAIPSQPVSISGNTNPCQASAQNYSVANSSGTYFNWTIPADWILVTGQGTNNITVVAGSASGTVEVVASNACGQAIAQMLNVVVSPLPAQPITINGNSVYCQGASATYGVTQTSGVTYNWSVPAGWIITGGQGTNTITVTIGANSGNVIVTPVNTCGNGISQVKNVTVNLLPPADAGIDKGICVGASINIGAPAIPGNTYSWTSSPAGFSSNSANPLVQPDTTTIYYLTETVTATGCSNTDAVTVVANQVIAVVATPPSYNMCTGSQTNISLASNITGTTFSWEAVLSSGASTTGFADGNGANIIQTINNASGANSVVTYSITAQANVCVNSLTSIDVTVYPAPIVNAQSITICSDITTSLTLGSSTNGVAAATYNITNINANGLIAVAGNPTTGTGFSNLVILDDAWLNTTANPVNVIYTVVPVSAFGCTGSSFQVTVTVKPKPMVTNPSVKSICSGTSTAINLTATIASSFSWTIGTVTGSISGASAGTGSTINQTLSNPSNTTAGTVQYIVTASSTAGSCQSATFIITVTVNPLPTVTNAITKTICSLSGTNISLTASTASTFTWTIGAITGGITGASAGSGSLINQVLTNPSATVAGTVNYIVTPTSTTGTCPGTPKTITVTVNPLPVITIGSSVNAVCPGIGFNLTSSSSNTTSPGIQWTSNPLGFTSTVANPTNVIQTVTSTYYVTYTNNTTGCSKTVSKTVTANPLPVPTISSDYCAVPGHIRLTAGGGGTYLWNTNQTSQIIDIDVAGVFSVTVTNSFGCTAAEYIDANNELVVDGSFTNFNPASPPFYTGYIQQQSYYNPSAPNPALTGLWPEGDYAVNTSAWYNPATGTGYHPNFHGQDHTNNSTGPRNFLMINGSTTDNPLKTIWQQTVTVAPNTDYYFSAWAMNLNPASPASLQFEVNGTLVGTIANMNSAPKPTTEGQVGLTNWVRFYSNPKWNSGSATTAVIRIVNLNTVAGGNDFGLDDISFGTLAPLPFTINPSTGGDICAGQTLYLYANITGGRAPIQYTWTGPNGFTSSLPNPVIPNTTVANAGTYTLSVVDGYGCNPVVRTTVAVINPLPSATISGTADVCQHGTQPNITFTGTAGTAPFTFIYKINGGSNQTISTISGNSVSLPVSTMIPGTFIYSLVSVSDVKGCSRNQSGFATVTVNSLPVCAISGDNPVCAGATGIPYTATDGFTAYSWVISGSGSIVGTTNTDVIHVNAGASYGTSFILTLNVTDSYGCSGINQVEMFIQDTTKPTLTLPPSPQNRNVVANLCSYTAVGNEFNPVSFADNCQVASVVNNLNGTNSLAGYVFPLGITTVVWTVTDVAGNATSRSFNVVIRDNQPPIISCPTSHVVCANNLNAYINSSNQWDATATDNCSLSGLDYTLSGATTGTGSTLNGVTFGVGNTTVKWRAVDASGNIANCANFTITVLTEPTISVQPQNNLICPFTTQAVFSVTAGPSTTYQWRKDGVNITGANAATYTINNPTLGNVGSYDVVVTNQCGTITSSPAQLIIPGPLFASIDTTSIYSSTGYDPLPIVLNMAKSGGAGPFTYQWQLNNGDINLATGTTYDPLPLMFTGEYFFRCKVCDACGTVFYTANKKITINEPLPIELIYFTAKCNNDLVTLNWSTMTETNNDYFTLQSSLDASNWEFVAEIDGAGNSNEVLYYQYTDDRSIGKLMYYRLKQTDFDGKYEIFSPISVVCSPDEINDVKIYPNPFTSDLKFEFRNEVSEKVAIKVYDMLGNVAFNQDISSSSNGSFYIDLQSLPVGVYNVEISSGVTLYHQKVIKQ